MRAPELAIVTLISGAGGRTYVGDRPSVAYDPLGLKKVCCTEAPSTLFAVAAEAAKKSREFVENGFIDVGPGAEVTAATYCMGSEKKHVIHVFPASFQQA